MKVSSGLYSLLTSLPPQLLRPRKRPRQARASATLEAIFEATVQVLLAEGEGRLTTTRVAARAGVSIGTLYQYYPHKQALLYAVLQRHLAHVAGAVEAACEAARGQSAAEMAGVLVHGFLSVKKERLDLTRALYQLTEDLDARTLIASNLERNIAVAARMLASARDAAFADVDAAAVAVFSAIAGSTRIAFERGPSRAALEQLDRDLTLMCRCYLAASDTQKAVRDRIAAASVPSSR